MSIGGKNENDDWYTGKKRMKTNIKRGIKK